MQPKLIGPAGGFVNTGGSVLPVCVYVTTHEFMLPHSSTAFTVYFLTSPQSPVRTSNVTVITRLLVDVQLSVMAPTASCAIAGVGCCPGANTIGFDGQLANIGGCRSDFHL